MSGTALRISTEDVPLRDRAEVAREVFGRQFLRLELEEIEGHPLQVDLKLRAWDGLRTVKGMVHGAKTVRSRALMSDGNDDIFITLNQTGSFHIAQRGHEVVLGSGDAQISALSEPSVYLRPQGTSFGLRIPHHALAARISDLDGQIGRKIPTANPSLSLLKAYISILDEIPAKPKIEQLAVTHIYDLVALCLSETVSDDRVCRNVSIDAARLQAMKKYIAANMSRPGLSVAQIASWQQITPRHVQRLFEKEGMTFTEFLAEIRLEHAHQILADHAVMGKRIGEIIFDVGFRDVSHFNRLFRKRFGKTPSDVRDRRIL